MYKLSLTKLRQSECSVSIYAHLIPYYPIMPSFLTIQLFKLLAYPVLMPPLHPLESFLISGAFHSMPPKPGSRIYGHGHTHMLPSIPCPVCLTGHQSVYWFLLLSPTSSPPPLRKKVEWSDVASRWKPQYICPFRAARSETWFFLGVSPHSMMCLCQQIKRHKNTSYGGTIIRAYPYTHGGQH